MLSFVLVFVHSEIFVVAFTLLILRGRERCSVLYCVTSMQTGFLLRAGLEKWKFPVKEFSIIIEDSIITSKDLLPLTTLYSDYSESDHYHSELQ